MLPALTGKLKPATGKAPDLSLIIGGHIIALLLAVNTALPPFGCKHGTAAHLPQDHDIGAPDNLIPEGGMRDQRVPGTGRTQPQIGLEMMPQVHQPVLAFSPAIKPDIIPCRPAHRADKHSISRSCLFQHGISAENPVRVIRCTVEQIVINLKFKIHEGGDSGKNPQPLVEDFRADPITAKRKYLCHTSIPTMPKANTM